MSITTLQATLLNVEPLYFEFVVKKLKVRSPVHVLMSPEPLFRILHFDESNTIFKKTNEQLLYITPLGCDLLVPYDGR